MRVLGVDFTSRPRRSKPIVVAACDLRGDVLIFQSVESLADFGEFDNFLNSPGPWVAGFDFPFAHSRKFIDGMAWPDTWPAYADHLAAMTRERYRELLEAYKAGRPYGDREHPRGFEAGSGAASPQKLYGVPVALMLFEGVPRLRTAGLHLPGLCDGDPGRQAVEAYPGVAARALLRGGKSYKTDDRREQTVALHDARRNILSALTGQPGRDRFTIRVEAPASLADDPSGDQLDALLCAVQAAWAFRAVLGDPARMAATDPREGWIADSSMFA
jgi:hypothetical protein